LLLYTQYLEFAMFIIFVLNDALLFIFVPMINYWW